MTIQNENAFARQSEGAQRTFDRNGETIGYEDNASCPPRKRYVASNQTPDGALTWPKAECYNAIRFWMKALMRRLGRHSRLMKIMAALQHLVPLKGYAYPTNNFLAEFCDLNLEAVERALLDLERSGFIIRAHVGGDRRIWLSVPGVTRYEDGLETRHDNGSNTRRESLRRPVARTGHKDSKGRAAPPPRPIEGQDETPDFMKTEFVPKQTSDDDEPIPF